MYKKTAIITGLAMLALSGCSALGKSAPAATVTVTQQPATATEESKTTPAAEKTTETTPAETTTTTKPAAKKTTESSASKGGASGDKIPLNKEKLPAKSVTTKGGKNMAMSDTWEGKLYYGTEFIRDNPEAEYPKVWTGKLTPMKVRKTSEVHKGQPIWRVVMKVEIQNTTSEHDHKINNHPVSYMHNKLQVPGMRGVTMTGGGSECYGPNSYCAHFMGETQPKELHLYDSSFKPVGASWKLDG